MNVRFLSLSFTLSAILFLHQFGVGADVSSVRVSSDNVGPRTMESQTRASVIRDYLRAWKTLDRSASENRADFLGTSFVGQAKDKLSETIDQQIRSKIQTRYIDKSHNIRILFYSPEGMSVQLTDNVEYDTELMHNGNSLGVQHVRSTYVAVLTPTESNWKVRLLQTTDLSADSDEKRIKED